MNTSTKNILSASILVGLGTGLSVYVSDAASLPITGYSEEKKSRSQLEKLLLDHDNMIDRMELDASIQLNNTLTYENERAIGLDFTFSDDPNDWYLGAYSSHGFFQTVDVTGLLILLKAHPNHPTSLHTFEQLKDLVDTVGKHNEHSNIQLVMYTEENARYLRYADLSNSIYFPEISLYINGTLHGKNTTVQNVSNFLSATSYLQQN